jgi:hypothetical protein
VRGRIGRLLSARLLRAGSAYAVPRLCLRSSRLGAALSRLKNHVKDIAAVDFFVVPTVRFVVLFVFIVLVHERRRVVHFNMTANPTAEWTTQQIVEAFPYDTAPRFLLRDRDGGFNRSPPVRLGAFRHRRRVGALRLSD